MTVAILSMICAFLFEDWKIAFTPDILLDTNVLTALIITSVFATALAFLIQTSVQKYTNPTRVALIFAMEPVFAAITGFIWAGDRLSMSAVCWMSTDICWNDLCGNSFRKIFFQKINTRKNMIIKKSSK